MQTPSGLGSQKHNIILPTSMCFTKQQPSAGMEILRSLILDDLSVEFDPLVWWKDRGESTPGFLRAVCAMTVHARPFDLVSLLP